MWKRLVSARLTFNWMKAVLGEAIRQLREISLERFLRREAIIPDTTVF